MRAITTTTKTRAITGLLPLALSTLALASSPAAAQTGDCELFDVDFTLAEFYTTEARAIVEITLDTGAVVTFTDVPAGTPISGPAGTLIVRIYKCTTAPTPEPTPTTAPEPTPTTAPEPTPTPAPEPTPTSAPEPTPEPTETPTEEPTETPEPTAVPTETPTTAPTPEPTETPEATATAAPTATPEATSVPQEPTPTPETEVLGQQEEPEGELAETGARSAGQVALFGLSLILGGSILVAAVAARRRQLA